MVVFVQNKSSDRTFTNMSDDDKEERHFSDDDENWTKLQDIASRRRIQNRISQRKRRRRLRENSLNSGTAPKPEESPSGSATQRPEVHRSKTDALDRRARVHPQKRTRSESQISDFSLNGDITPTQIKSKSSFTKTPEPMIPSTLSGSWDQQFFDQAFMSDMSGSGYEALEGGTLDFLYGAGSNGMFKNPTYAPLSCSPSLSYTSEGSMDGSFDTMSIDPKLTTDFDELFTSHVPFEGSNDLCLTTTPPLDFATSADGLKSFPISGGTYPTPPSSLPSLTNTPDSVVNNNFTDTSGNTALHLAASKGHMGIVQLLLDTGIDINSRNKDGASSLHIAISSNNLSMAALLLEKGAAADAKNSLGQNALHLAVEKGNVALVSMVLDHAVVVDARDCLGQTAFHRAVAMGWEEVVRLMLLRGVNSNAKVGQETKYESFV